MCLQLPFCLQFCYRNLSAYIFEIVVNMKSVSLYFVLVLVATQFCGVNTGGKSGKKRISSTPNRSTRLTHQNSSVAATSRSLNDWLAMPLESLRLAANFVNLAVGGSRSTLARRLFEHHQLHADSSTPVSVEVPADIELPGPSSAVPASAISTDPPRDVNLSVNVQEYLRDQLHQFLSDNMATLATTMRSAAGPIENSSTVQLNRHNGVATTIAGTQNLSSIPAAAPPPNHFSIANTPSTMRNSRLPPVPQAVLDRIRQGEFVNFDLLLPSVTPLSLDEYSIKINAGDSTADSPSISLVPRHQSRPKVFDIYTWLAAWNHYLQAMSVYHPHLLISLLRYQALITKLATQYSFPGWSTYDRLFRLQIVNDPSASWDKLDDDLFNHYVKGSPIRPNCYACHNYGHLSTNCPLRSASGRNPSTTATDSSFPTSNSQFMAHPPFRAPQRSGHQPPTLPTTSRTCNFYNNRGQCFAGSSCPYSHTCRICFGEHPQSECPRRRSYRE